MLAAVRDREIRTQRLRLGSCLSQAPDDVFVAAFSSVVVLLVFHGSFTFARISAARGSRYRIRRSGTGFGSRILLRQRHGVLDRREVEWSSVLVT